MRIVPSTWTAGWLLLACASAASVARPPAQTVGPTSPPEATPTTREPGSEGDDAARTLLESAVVAQGKPPFELPVRDYRLEGVLEVTQPGHSVSSMHTVDFVMVYAAGGRGSAGRIRTELEDKNFKTRTVTGFDGRSGWLSGARGVVRLEGKEFQPDRDSQLARLRLARLLQECLVLRTFMDRGGAWTLGEGDGQGGLRRIHGVVALGEEEADALYGTFGEREGTAEIESDTGGANDGESETPGEPSAEVELALDSESYELREAVLRLPPRRDWPEGVVQRTVFSWRGKSYWLTLEGGFRLPQVFDVFRGDGTSKLFHVSLRRASFNQGVRDEDFAAPR